jgi:hypothetical protein
MGFFDDDKPYRSGPNRRETHRQQSDGSWLPDNDLTEWDCNRQAKVLLLIGVAGLSAILGILGVGIWGLVTWLS